MILDHSDDNSADAYDVRLESNSEVRARNWAIRFYPQEQTSPAGPVRPEKCQHEILPCNEGARKLTRSLR